jgi:hypothetical protein
MTTSEQVDKIFQALVKAQSEMGKAKKVNDNHFFKSKYADLSELIEVSKDVLTSNGLAVIQSPGASGQAVTVTTRIIHSSGQWIEDAIALQAIKTDPQAIGSAITYARRYQLAALLNIAQEDDDGNSASDRHDSDHEQKKPAEQKKPMSDADKAKFEALKKRYTELVGTLDESGQPVYDATWKAKWNARLKEAGCTVTIKEIEADLGGNK